MLLWACQGNYLSESSLRRSQHATQGLIVTAVPYGEVILTAAYSWIADDCVVNDVITMFLVIACQRKEYYLAGQVPTHVS